MSVLSARGGIPDVQAVSIDTTGRKVRLPFFINHLKIRVSGNPCLMYFTEADFDGGVNYVTVPVAAAATPYGEWEGPVETSKGKYEHIWLKGSGGTSVVELVTFQRRG